MYNQSGMGGEHHIRPPVSLPNLPNLPNLPLPPDMSRLHHEKALNLQVATGDEMCSKSAEKNRTPVFH
jgi:hypothetical protein